jgi:hypothetical protein
LTEENWSLICASVPQPNGRAEQESKLKSDARRASKIFESWRKEREKRSRRRKAEKQTLKRNQVARFGEKAKCAALVKDKKKVFGKQKKSKAVERLRPHIKKYESLILAQNERWRQA